MIKKIGILSLALLGFTACEKDDDSDSSKPVITLETPTNEQEFEPGDNISVKGSITDNEALASYKLDIHYGGDHDHGKVASEWTYVQTWEASGKLVNFEHSVSIPADTEHGEYHVIVYATDEAGNEAELVEADVIIEVD